MESTRNRTLSFRIAGRELAMRLDEVSKIVPLPNDALLSPVPGAPAAILGLVEVRGRLITLIDPILLFGWGAGMTGRDRGPRAAAILLAGSHSHLGLLVDEAGGIASGDEVDNAPPLLTAAEITSRSTALVQASYRLPGGKA